MHLYIEKEVSKNSHLCDRDAELVMGYHFAGGYDLIEPRFDRVP
jgi:hypothetical protein